MKHVRWANFILCAALAGSILCGCATIRHPVPMDLVGKATVDDMADVRVIVGIPNPGFQKSIMQALLKDEPGDYRADSSGNKIYPMLTISGGAANGAYGGGLLKGWSKEGSRPNFKIVTGISTGAITAPMAFLGKEYDAMIEFDPRNMRALFDKGYDDAVNGYKWHKEPPGLGRHEMR